MKKEITAGQLLSACVTLLIALITGWITMNNKVSSLEARQDALEHTVYQMQLNFDKKMDKMDYKIDDLIQKTTDILIKLENKENRR